MTFLLESYVFYVDVYLVQNVLIKFTVLFLTLYVHKQRDLIFQWKGIRRLCVISFIATVIEIIGLYRIPVYVVFFTLSFFLEMPLMFFVLTRKTKIKWHAWILTAYFFTVLINGIVELIWNLLGEKIGYVFVMLIACACTVFGILLWKMEQAQKRGIYTLSLYHHEKKIELEGYYDSGNHLKDPYSKKGVHILSKEVIEELVTNEEKHLYIPFEALGTKQGLIEIIYIEKMQIKGENELLLERVPIGIAEDSLFEGKQYKLILNEEVF